MVVCVDVVVSTADDSSVGILMNTLHVYVHQYNNGESVTLTE